MQSESSDRDRAGGCLARLFWLGVGNFILVLSAIGIGQRQNGFSLGWLDVVLWATAFGLIAVRYADIAFFQGQTADSRPATMSDWRRYALTVLAVSLALWLGAHAISW